MPSTTKTAPKTATAKKVTVRKSAAKKTAPKATAKPATRKPAKKATAKKATTTWIRQSTVGYDPEVGASRFTTQTQRRLLREIVATGKKGTTFPEAKPATIRSIERLLELKLVSGKATAKLTATDAGRKLVA